MKLNDGSSSPSICKTFVLNSEVHAHVECLTASLQGSLHFDVDGGTEGSLIAPHFWKTRLEKKTIGIKCKRLRYVL